MRKFYANALTFHPSPADSLGVPVYHAVEADTELNALRAQLTEAKAVLREVEWSVESDDRGALCPQCGGSRDIAFYHSSKDRAPIRGHAPDCRLAKILEGR